MTIEWREEKPCKWCGKMTPHLGTLMCDGCWELDHRISGDLMLAEWMVAYHRGKRNFEEKKA